MTLSQPTTKLHYDAAQATPERDQFGFRDLADRLTANIHGLLDGERGAGGFVLGLEGRWGSGKSTILNYLRVSLGAALKPKTQFLLDFDPWWLEEDANIVSALLSAVLNALPKGEAAKATSAVGKLAGAVGKLPEGLDVLLKLSKKTERVAELVAAARDAGGDLGKLLNASKPVRKLRDEVAAAFGEKGLSFVVLIDDLDRLAPEKAIRVMNAIKSIADLPGFVYVLAYDPLALGNILNSYKPPLGTNYFEKIVNVSVPVPPVTYSQMEGFVGALLNPALRDAVAASAAHQRALVGILDTPRDAIRLANAANFWVGGKVSELHLPDFVLLEAIRLARPAAYTGILRTSGVWLNAEAPDFLSQALGSSDTAKEAARKSAATAVMAALELGGTARDKPIRAALEVLFPKATSYLGDAAGFEDHYFEVAKDRRAIEQSGHFFTYFLHRPLPGSPSREEIDALISPTGSLHDRSELVAAISRRPVGDVAPLAHLVALLDAERDHDRIAGPVLFELVQALAAPTTHRRPAAPADVIGTDLRLVRSFAARSMKKLGRLTDEQVAALMDASLDLEVVGQLHVLLTAGSSYFKGAREDRLVEASDTALQAATDALVGRILAGIADDTVFGLSKAANLLSMAYLQDPEAFAAAIAPVFADDRRLVALVETFHGYSAVGPSLSKYAGLELAALKARVQDAYTATGRAYENRVQWTLFGEDDDD